jgi:hypothetical protein
MKAKTQTEFAKKWVGICSVKSGDIKVKFTSTEVSRTDNKAKTFPDGELSMTFPLDSLPKLSKRVIKPNMDGTKKFRIRLNEDGDAVDGVTPVSGVFPAKLIGIGPKDRNGNYKLIHKTYNPGTDKENSHDEFIALYEITDGPFKEVELPGYYLHYKFEEVPEGDEDEGFTQFNTADTPQASQLHKLQAWAEVHGNVLDEPIKWPDDGIILETIEERALDADRPVNLVFENGYIKSVQPLETYEDDDEEESEEEFDEKFPEQEEEVVEVPAKSPKADSRPKKPIQASKPVQVAAPKKDVLQDTVKGKAKQASAKPVKKSVKQDDDDDL